MTTTATSGIDGWCILELMGHRRLGGRVSEVSGGALAGFVRIDVPGDGGEGYATQFYGPQAIYCLTPTTEEMARAVAARNRPEPVTRWELPERIEAPERDQTPGSPGSHFNERGQLIDRRAAALPDEDEDEDAIDDIRHDAEDLEDGPVGGEGGQ